MAIILPKEGSIWETLGSGLGSGLSALAQGKVQQMQKRNYAGSLQQMGLSPDIAYLPENLQPLVIKQHYKGLEALRKEQQAEALFEQGVNLGGDPDMLRQAHAAGNLKAQVNKLGNSDNPSYAQKLGITASKKNQFRLSPEKQKVNQLAQELSGSSGIQALQQRPQLNNSQQNQLAMPTRGLQQTQSNVLENQGFTPQEQLLMQSLENPNISAEKKQEIREVIQAAKGYDWKEKIGGLPVNLASGLAQGTGSGFGLSSILNWLNSFPSTEEKLLNRDLRNSSEGSPIHESSKKQLGNLKEREKQVRKLPEAADIKENLVRPFVKSLGMERLIDQNDAANKIAERVGKATPQRLLAAVLTGGGSLGSEIGRALASSGFSEGLGEMLGQRVLGSNLADGILTAGGYLLSRMEPDLFKKTISKGYQGFRNLVSKAPAARVNASPLADVMSEIGNEVKIAPKLDGNRFLEQRLNEVQTKFHKGQISPKVAWDLDDEFGGEVAKKAYEYGDKIGDRLTRLRQGLRSIYEPHYTSIDKVATEGLIEARKAKSAVEFSDKIQEQLEDLAKSGGGFFSKFLFSLRKTAGGGASIRKLYKTLEKSPALRNAFFEVLQSGATKNRQGITDAVMKIKKGLAELK